MLEIMVATPLWKIGLNQSKADVRSLFRVFRSSIPSFSAAYSA